MRINYNIKKQVLSSIWEREVETILSSNPCNRQSEEKSFISKYILISIFIQRCYVRSCSNCLPTMAGEEGTFGFLAGDQLILSVHSATMLTCCSTTQVKKNDDCLLMQSRLKNIFLRRCLADESSGRCIIMKCKMGNARKTA